MSKKILWIDDDYYAIQGLFRPLEKGGGYIVETAISALDGFNKAQKWKNYDLIVVDLILPISEQQEKIPDVVSGWEDEGKFEHVGIGLVKWLLLDMKVKCPVVILSVIPNPITAYKLDNIGLTGYIRKSGLLPTVLKEEIYSMLGIK